MKKCFNLIYQKQQSYTLNKPESKCYLKLRPDIYILKINNKS